MSSKSKYVNNYQSFHNNAFILMLELFRHLISDFFHISIRLDKFLQSFINRLITSKNRSEK